MAVVAFAGVIAGCGGDAEPAIPATVTWEPTSLTVTLLPGTSQTLGAALTVAQATSDVTLETSPEIAAWLEASVASTTVEKGHPAQITLGLRALVSVAPGTYTGSVAADLRDTGSGRSLARAATAAAVLANASTQMTLTASADPVRAGQLVQYTATVINRSAVPHLYVITVPVPAGMSVAAGSISQGASGAQAGCGATLCVAGSVIQWGNNTGYPAGVGAGQSLTVTFVAQVDTSTHLAAGTVMHTTASAVGDATSASAAAHVVVRP